MNKWSQRANRSSERSTCLSAVGQAATAALGGALILETTGLGGAGVTDRAQAVTDSCAFWTSAEYLMLLEALSKYFTSCDGSSVTEVYALKITLVYRNTLYFEHSYYQKGLFILGSGSFLKYRVLLICLRLIKLHINYECHRMSLEDFQECRLF